MNKMELKEIITKAKYLTKYEAILDVNTLDIFAYEALSKFETKFSEISTEDIFKKLHKDNQLFFKLEKRNKELQVSNFIYPNKKLFLNFDADICFSKEQRDYWDMFFKNNCDNLVVEITENGSEDERRANAMKDFSKWLKLRKIDTALDDFASEGSMFSFSIMDNSNYLKIDKSFIRMISKNLNYKYYLKGVIDTMRLENKKTIIEGIETYNDLSLAKELGCDYIQGYLFKTHTIIK